MPKLLDRYIFCEWLKIFAISIGVTLGILILHDMYDNLGHLIEWNASSRDILWYYALLLPTIVPIVLPISLLLSLIYILGALHRNNEITAMRSAGMNVFKITRSLWFAGALLAGLLLWLNASIIPFAKEELRTLYDNIKYENQMKHMKVADVGKVANMCFNNRRDDRLWFTNSFSVVTNLANGVRVSVLDDKGREISRVMAREGVYDDVKKCWYFKDGQEITYQPQTHRAIKAIGFEKKYYEDFKEEPKIMVLSMRRTKDLSLYETKMLIDAFEGENSYEARPYLVRWYSIWGSAFACIIVVAIAIPFSVAGVRTNPMVGVSKTVGLFFLYFVLDSLFSTLGGRGFVPPFWAASIPVILIMVFTLSLYRKVV